MDKKDTLLAESDVEVEARLTGWTICPECGRAMFEVTQPTFTCAECVASRHQSAHEIVARHCGIKCWFSS
jgi:hypothetical protein